MTEKRGRLRDWASRVSTWLLLLPLTVLLAAFAVANRHDVVVSLEPLPFEWPAPLYGVAFTAALLGLLAGGLIAWWRAGRLRRALRAQRRQMQELKAERDRLQAENGRLAAEAASDRAKPVLVDAA